MKIEAEIPDIKREEVIEAMARQLLGEWHEGVDHETGPYREYRATQLGVAMRKYLSEKLDEVVDALVKDKFDAAIVERITVAIDGVLREGWTKTDEYGAPRGGKVDLKARISEYLTERDRYRSPSLTRIDTAVKETVEKTLTGEFKKEIDAAVKSLRAQLDAAVTSKFTDAIKAAMGVK